MKKLSRRSVLGTIASASVLGFALPTSTAAADQPRMQAALEALRVAERELNAATSDKGGHRNAALRLVIQAINQVEKGIRFDRRN